MHHIFAAVINTERFVGQNYKSLYTCRQIIRKYACCVHLVEVLQYILQNMHTVCAWLFFVVVCTGQIQFPWEIKCDYYSSTSEVTNKKRATVENTLPEGNIPTTSATSLSINAKNANGFTVPNSSAWTELNISRYFIHVYVTNTTVLKLILFIG